jgi:hypothetical protein
MDTPTPSRRSNAGRPTEIDDPVSRTQVMLDERSKRLLLVIGDGNLSKGVRVAARVAYDRYQRTPSR